MWPQLNELQGRQEEVRKDSPVETSEGAWPGQHLDFRLLTPRTERISFCCVQVPQVCGNLLELTQPFATSYQGHQERLPGYQAREDLSPLDIRLGVAQARPHAQRDMPPAPSMHSSVPTWGYQQRTLALTTAPACIQPLELSGLNKETNSPGSHSQRPSWDQAGSTDDSCLDLGNPPVCRLNAPPTPAPILYSSAAKKTCHTVWSEILLLGRTHFQIREKQLFKTSPKS